MSSRDPDLARLRRALHSQNRHERAQAAVELGYRSDRESLDELRGMTKDADDLVAISAMFGRWQLGDEHLSFDRMAAGLASSDEECVQLTVQALCNMGAAVVPALVNLLEAGSPHAPHILRILGDIGGPESRRAVEHVAHTGDQSLADVARAVLDDWRED